MGPDIYAVFNISFHMSCQLLFFPLFFLLLQLKIYIWLSHKISSSSFQSSSSKSSSKLLSKLQVCILIMNCFNLTKSAWNYSDFSLNSPSLHCSHVPHHRKGQRLSRSKQLLKSLIYQQNNPSQLSQPVWSVSMVLPNHGT